MLRKVLGLVSETRWDTIIIKCRWHYQFKKKKKKCGVLPEKQYKYCQSKVASHLYRMCMDLKSIRQCTTTCQRKCVKTTRLRHCVITTFRQTVFLKPWNNTSPKTRTNKQQENEVSPTWLFLGNIISKWKKLTSLRNTPIKWTDWSCQNTGYPGHYFFNEVGDVEAILPDFMSYIKKIRLIASAPWLYK